MVQVISGKKGKGKTKILLDKVNQAVKDAKGSVVFLDKNTKHMFELSNRVRLIDVSQYPVNTYDGFLGFLCGIISQDHDLQEVYLDSFMTIAHVDNVAIGKAVDDLTRISEQYNIKFVLSVSEDNANLPENVQAVSTDAL